VLVGRRQIAQGSPGATVISGDSKLLASAGDDNVITIQNLATGDHVATLRGHKAQVRALAFSADGKTLASSASDQTLRLWHVATWREMGVLHRGPEFTSLAFAGTPERLIAIGASGRSVFPDAFAATK
jgi:WD40 repeat protein